MDPPAFVGKLLEEQDGKATGWFHSRRGDVMNDAAWWACVVPGQKQLAIVLCLAGIHCGVADRGQDRFFVSDAIRIRYRLSGQGAPVVLVHGFGETLERWETAGVVQRLSRHYQVITMDVRGHGRSTKPHDPTSYGPQLAADVVHLLRHLGVARAHIVGYSMGALVALDVGVLHHEHALSVVLGGAGWTPPEALEEFERQAAAMQQGKLPARGGDDPQALAALLRGFRVVSEEDLRRISVPMAAVIGGADRFLPDVRRLSRVLPRVEVVVIPEATHATAMDHPMFARAILAFLQKQQVRRR
jgi:pimeloyl-ACP methyl ester carboxylesterase